MAQLYVIGALHDQMIGRYVLLLQLHSWRRSGLSFSAPRTGTGQFNWTESKQKISTWSLHRLLLSIICVLTSRKTPRIC